MVGLLSKIKMQSVGLLCLLLALLSGILAFAQDSGMTLTPGQATTGALNNDTIAQIFTFDAPTAEVVTLVATNTDSLALAMLLTDASGVVVAQARDINALGETRLSATLPAAGTYYVTVLPVIGVESSLQGAYSLSLTFGEVAQTPSPTTETTPPVEVPVAEQVNTTSGIQVSVTWNSAADMDLEIRDPVGGALFFNTPEVESGGSFGANVNQGCQNVVSQQAKEEAAWPPGGVPVGSYEVLVYYQQACENSGPVNFVINATVDGVALDPINGTLLSGQVFISSFRVNADGTAQTSPRSGVKGDESLPASAAVIIAGARPITLGTSVQGIITSEQPYQAYTFTGQANQFVSITMNANSGSLDPYIALLDPSGNVLYFNDDAGEGITDSALTNSLLIVAGEYTVVATRYGLAVGGTEGGYELAVTGATTTQTPVETTEGAPVVEVALPAEVTNLQLPEGNIEVTLIWNTAADLQLLVRDPAGDSVFDDVTSIRSGGRLGAAGNANCVPATSTTPVSYIYWPTNIAPRAGSYEVDVWFQNECNDTTPISFTLYVSAGGRQVLTESISTNQPFLQGEHFVTSFTIDPSGAVTPGQGGITGLETLNWESDIENGLLINVGDSVNGALNADNKFDLYVFRGESGDEVSVTMTAAPGTNLDTKLYLIGPNGAVVTQNDDIQPGENTNSLINNFTLPSSGQYIIIATHYGEQYGITSGAYTLSLN